MVPTAQPLERNVTNNPELEEFRHNLSLYYENRSSAYFSCDSATQLKANQSCDVMCDETKYYKQQSSYACPAGGGIAVAPLKCIEKGKCAPLKFGGPGDYAGIIPADTDACQLDQQLFADSNCSVTCGDAFVKPKGRQIFACGPEGGTAESTLRCVPTGKCRLPEDVKEFGFGSGIVTPGYAQDCKIGSDWNAPANNKKIVNPGVCLIKCDDEKGWWPGIGNYNCPEEGGFATTSLTCEPTVCKRPKNARYRAHKEWSLQVPTFDVSVACAEGFHGEAIALPCAKEPVITLIDTERICKNYTMITKSEAYPLAEPPYKLKVRIC